MSYMFTHVVEDLKVREIQYDQYAFFCLLTILMKSPYFLGFVRICVSVACITCALCMDMKTEEGCSTTLHVPLRQGLPLNL